MLIKEINKSSEICIIKFSNSMSKIPELRKMYFCSKKLIRNGNKLNKNKNKKDK